MLEKILNQKLLILAIILIALKLGNLITLSWLWVLSPLWIPLVFAASVVIIVLLFAVIITIAAMTVTK